MPDGLPQVPTIPTTAVQSAADGVSSSNDIMSIVGGLGAAANAKLPDQYTTTQQPSDPHLPQHMQFDNNRKTNNVPITGQVADVKRARRQNAVAGLANTIGQFGEQIQAKKQAEIKDKLIDVMKAKQNVANATQVMQDPNASDQQKQMAQNVLQTNKKAMNDILSDPKHQKQLAKALDISFIDPEKNKTPEVKAFQEATKEFKAAGPFNADNPQEHQVAQLANKPAAGSPQAAQNLPASKPTAQPTQAAATPYADAALKKDLPGITTNPQYEAQLKQKEAAQKQLAAITPKLIDAQSKALIQQAKDGNAQAREEFKFAADYQTKAMQEAKKLEGIDARDKAQIQAESMRARAQVAAASIRAAATVKAAEIKGRTEEDKLAVKKQGSDDLNKQITQTDNQIKSFGQQVNDIKTSSLKPEEKKAALDKANFSYNMAVEQRKQYQAILAKNFPEFVAPTSNSPGAPEVKGPSLLDKAIGLGGSFESMIWGGSGSGNKSTATDTPKPEVKAVGASASDSDEDSSEDDDDNSDDFGNN